MKGWEYVKLDKYDESGQIKIFFMLKLPIQYVSIILLLKKF